MTQTTEQLNPRRIAIILLTVATALVHLWLAFSDGLDVMFLLNGLGYLTLVTALYAPIPQLAPYRTWIRWALMAFAGVTILGWVAIGLRIPIAYVDKVIEVALVVLLYLDGRQAQGAKS